MNTLKFNKILPDPNWVIIDWTMSNVCNYACEYCPSMTHNGSYGWPTLESVDYTTKKLQEHYGKNKNLEYILLGGELAIWKKFPDAVDIIKDNNPYAHIKFITNGIMPSDYWSRIGKKITSAVFSYHPTQVKDIKKFVESINALDNEYKTILVLAWPDTWEKVIKAREYILEHVHEFTSLELKIVDNRFQSLTSSKVNYTLNQIEYIKKNRKVSKSNKSIFKPSFTYLNDNKLQEVTGDILVNEQNKFKGWYCGIGVDKITLDADGSIRRGSGCMIGKNEDFGNWKTLDIKYLPSNGVTCPYNSCWCMPDLMATKLKATE
jgi:organic radical activating enzyme